MKPILFNTEMVRAILDGRKTVTRRVMKLPHCGYFEHDPPLGVIQPYRPGDILYVRETWALHECNDRLPIPCKKTADGRDCYIYRADGMSGRTPCGVHPSPHPWHPSIHMPREAARIFLRVKDVRVERLHSILDTVDLQRDFAIAPEAIKAVGAEAIAKPLWDSTVKSADRALYGWEANPWVWVIKFERISKED